MRASLNGTTLPHTEMPMRKMILMAVAGYVWRKLAANRAKTARTVR
jgi:hypothetical protein